MSIGGTLSPVFEKFSREIAEYGNMFQNSVVSQAMQAHNQMPQTMLGLSSALNTLPSQSVMQTAMRAQQFKPPASVLKAINSTQALLPVTPIMNSIESTKKAILPPVGLNTYQNMQTFIQNTEVLKYIDIASQITPTNMLTLSPIMGTNQMIEQMTRFQNVCVATCYDTEDFYDNDEFVDDKKPERDEDSE